MLLFLIGILSLTGAAGLITILLAARSRRVELDRFLSLLSLEPHKPFGALKLEQPTAFLPTAIVHKLYRAGWDPAPRHIIPIIALFLLALLAANIVAGPFAAFLAGIALLSAAAAALEYRIQRRKRLISDNMLSFLERVCQLLSVGNSLSTALARAVDHSPVIIVQCLTPAIRRIHNGTGVAESLERCATETDVYELYLLATAARTNLRFGGSMTLLLKNIIENIRKRATIERELRADTTQIRSSAWVLALLPMLVATVVMLTNAGYARWFLVTPPGHKMIVYAIISQLAGALLMRTITKTEY